MHWCIEFHCMFSNLFITCWLCEINPKWSWEAMKRVLSHMYYSLKLTLHTSARRKIFLFAQQWPNLWEAAITLNSWSSATNCSKQPLTVSSFPLWKNVPCIFWICLYFACPELQFLCYSWINLILLPESLTFSFRRLTVGI